MGLFSHNTGPAHQPSHQSRTFSKTVLNGSYEDLIIFCVFDEFIHDEINF